MRLPRPRLQDRLVLFVVVLLATVQLSSFVFIRYAIERTAENTLREEVATAARVFRRLLDQTDQQRLGATLVVALDYGLRAAIAGRDRQTLLSAMRNHAGRVRASGMTVIGLDGRVVADLLGDSATGREYADTGLIERAEREGHAAGVRLADGRVLRAIVVPVLAPKPIGYVAMEYALDDRLAREMQRLASADISIVMLGGVGRTLLVASTLPASQHAQLIAQARRIVAEGLDGISVRFDENNYEALALGVPDASRLRIYAILQRSSAERIAPYLALQAALLFIGAISLSVTLAGSIRIARNITRPMAGLAEAAREVARGNYGVRVKGGDDEMGDLARAFNGMVEGLAERDNMRDVLGKVASPEVVSALLEGRIELGGQELDATVMFTDLRDFTALCEKLTPQQSLAFLNEFLTEISEVVEAHGGVVDKYVGDGVMALFGAPVTRLDDAQRAVEAALEVRDRIEQLRPRLAARGMPSPEIGMGLSTSRVVAGNVGSPSRLNYTVLGDGVNLASRLEGLTKRYQVTIVVSDRTRAAVTGIVFRELDKVRVKGRNEAGRIWEPLGRAGTLSAEEIEHLSRWHEALHMFRQREFAAARDFFASLAHVRGYERPAGIYLENIAAMRAAPPGPDWDAAFTLYDK